MTALALITPSFDPDLALGTTAFAGWDPLAQGLREGGVEGFLLPTTSPMCQSWRNTVEKVVRQRLAGHERPEAVADALEVVPRSRPFEDIDALAGIEAPTVVVATRDEADPGHPLAVGERYAGRSPRRR